MVRKSPEHPFLTVQETAQRLGYSHMTIRRRIAAGQFPALRIGSKALVPRVFVDAVTAAAAAGQTVDVDDFAADWQARHAGEVS